MKRRDWLQGAIALGAVGGFYRFEQGIAAEEIAEHVPVLIDAQRRLGPAAAIGDLIGSQCDPYTFGFDHPDRWGIEAWREVGFNVGDIALFHYEGSNPYTVSGKIVGMRVRRGRNGRLDLDWRDFDRNIEFMRRELQVQRIDFTVWGTPKPLADPAAGDTFFFHAPANYDEWHDLVSRAVRHIAHDLNLPGSTYKPWTEPDSGYYWRGRARAGYVMQHGLDPNQVRRKIITGPRILEDYFEKYVRDWHTIKRVDPTARVSGTFNVWSKKVASCEASPATSGDPGACAAGTYGFVLDDFLERIDEYNAQHPSATITVDEIAYQDYNWRGNGLAEGVMAANELVRKHRLPGDIPLVLTGWNKDMKDEPNLARRAAYVVANIIGELVPTDRPRTLARAYLWPFDYDYYGRGIAPVIMPYPAVEYSGDDGSDDPLSIAPITEYSKRPLHAGLKMLAQMKPGTLISSESPAATLRVLASTQADGSVMAVIANHGARRRRVGVQLTGTSLAGPTLEMLIQRVDATHSADGRGLEQGSSQTVRIRGDSQLPALDVAPWSVTGITLRQGV